ncbi:uncharacterized protein LOC119361085 isoform X3 [Triticum dicoccoides]|uniref:uncharacterized protein LOC119361085 isoform X3 n=1 Tax=Triticum dicoccoides TaxID=85692 RepID=UPI00188DDF19|nr:uncharacterized protein LOC119361085 isoform X3 [Triticum dicoccoides]
MKWFSWWSEFCKILKKQLNFPRESSTCKDSYTKGSLYTKTSRMIRAEDLDLIVRLDGSKYDKESTERGTCMNRTEELLYAIKAFAFCSNFRISAFTQASTSSMTCLCRLPLKRELLSSASFIMDLDQKKSKGSH